MQALTATFEIDTSGFEKDGYLVKERFYILLAELQHKLSIDDGLFRNQFLNGGLLQSAALAATQNHRPQTPISESPSIASSEAKTPYGSNSGQQYVDWFTENHSELPSRSITIATGMIESEVKPSTTAKLETTGRPAITSSKWTCSVCTLENPISALVCDACNSKNHHGVQHTKGMLSGQMPSTAQHPNPVLLLTSRDKGSIDSEENEVFEYHANLPTMVQQLDLHGRPADLTSDSEQTVIKDPLKPEATEDELTTTVHISSDEPPPKGKETQAPQNHQRPYLTSKISPDEPAIPIITRDSERAAQAMVMNIQTRTKRRGIWFGSRRREKTANGFAYSALAEALRQASINGDLPLVASILELGADINYSSPKEKSEHNAIRAAVQAKKSDVVEYLLERGTNKSSAESALRAAIKMGSIEIAKKLVPYADFTGFGEFHVEEHAEFASDVFVDIVESCMSLAIRMKHPDRSELVRLMIDHPSFSPNDKVILFLISTTPSFKPPLFTGTALVSLAMKGDLIGAKHFFQRFGSEYNISHDPQTNPQLGFVDPLSCISVTGWREDSSAMLELTQLLLEHGAKIESPNFYKQTPCSPITTTAAGCSTEGVKFFLGHGADPESLIANIFVPEVADYGAYPLLGYAALKGKVEICQALIEKGAISWRADRIGETPLVDACRGGNFETVEYLLSVDKKRSSFDKCLVVAVKTNNPEVVKALLDAGARSQPSTWISTMEQDFKPEYRAKHAEIIDLLLTTECKLDREVVLTAIDSDNFAGLSRLLEKRGGVLDFNKNTTFENARWASIWGSNLLNCRAYAKKKGATQFVELLGSYGWDQRSGL